MADHDTRTILLASLDPVLTSLKVRVLEHAGYRVIVASTASNIANRCFKEKIDLVLIGSSLAPEEKRRFWTESRVQCSLVLELYRHGSPALMDAYVHHPVTSVDFLQAVQAVLSNH